MIKETKFYNDHTFWRAFEQVDPVHIEEDPDPLQQILLGMVSK